MNLVRAFFFLLPSLVHGADNLYYSDLEALELACPARDKCHGYKNNLSYLDRSCECDSACGVYQDCCIDARRRWSNGLSTAGNGMVCMHYGEKQNTGVYAITRCSSDWTGSSQIREKCEGSQDDLSDPLFAAPVTSVARAVTYRNRYCAECNNADVSSLTLFQLRMICDGIDDSPYDQLLADLAYNRTLNMWGVNRQDYFSKETQFYGCDIIFDVPSYLNSSVRFCRSNLISSCPQTWTRFYVRWACEEYMSVVFDYLYAYRNPHCAICNGKTIDQLTCTAYDLSRRKRPVSPIIWIDINRRDGDLVGMARVPTPECAANWKYDPFFKKCRRLVCALPGHVVVDGRCVSS